MLADQRLEPLAAVPAQHHPELERAEPPPERRAVGTEVDGSLGGGEVVAVRRKRRVERLGRLVQSVEQSIGVKSHLCGFTTTESACSTPSRHQRSSGHTAAEPA